MYQFLICVYVVDLFVCPMFGNLYIEQILCALDVGVFGLLVVFIFQVLRDFVDFQVHSGASREISHVLVFVSVTQNNNRNHDLFYDIFLSRLRFFDIVCFF